ncbi:GGDEF domain-containing response regulator [Novosphingobium profundi]|uniref:putative bifunctional diguanylate cyclase/phosphodiesterase n=1 Tax=Novosphingobium profundi TaxID=1774954 RepID=UPI001BDB55D5|nr:GGDEF domain-containing response regulator [Novosphingobium profundi]MBT0666937.1 GGDEF domain-containing response regulator [Novosphingobium profundi]
MKHATIEKAAGADAAPDTQEPLHVLIVDDDDVDREKLSRLLHRCPWRIEVKEAASRREALDLIRTPETRFDVVFLDFGLTDGDGRDLLPPIREELDPDCPIIAVTGHGSAQIAADSIKLGMTEFLTKRMLSAEKVAASIEEGMAWRQDRQALRQAEAELTHRSLHDPLTDLPNRTLFFDRLTQACARARRSGDAFAVLMVDLDRFKEINDSLGHAAGDVVLQTIGRRLRSHLREVDTVARLGGDEFAILLENIATVDAAMAMGDKISQLIQQPVLHDNRVLYVGASLGIALCPQLGYTPTALLSAADNAMYEAKAGIEKTCLARSQQSDDTEALDSKSLLEELAQAIADHAITWHWQPKIDLASATVTGFEALVRWQPYDSGNISPEQLIRIVEQSPLIEPFTVLCLDTVLGQFASVQDAWPGTSVSINVSARMLERPSFVENVLGAIEIHKIAPERVILELTETALIAHPAQARRVIERLRRHCLRLSIDDFGAGFTSFGYLREFTVDEIKIDRSFISRCTQSAFDQSLITCLVVLCDSLGITLVAEGIEDDEVRALLIHLGCPSGQGYGISRPLAFDALQGWMHKWNSTAHPVVEVLPVPPRQAAR